MPYGSLCASSAGSLRAWEGLCPLAVRRLPAPFRGLACVCVCVCVPVVCAFVCACECGWVCHGEKKKRKGEIRDILNCQIGSNWIDSRKYF